MSGHPRALTDKQASVLAFVEWFTAHHRWAPTRREISDHFGWGSINAAEMHVKALIRKGRLARRAGAWHAARSLYVVERPADIAADSPALAAENSGAGSRIAEVCGSQQPAVCAFSRIAGASS